MTMSSSDDRRDRAAVRSLYQQLIWNWNARDAELFAALFADEGSVVGFDGSQYDGRAEIEAMLRQIFADHKTGAYAVVVREIRPLGHDACLLRAVAGMVPSGQEDVNPALNSIQSLVAVRHNDHWRIALFQNTPAAWHGRPEAVQALTVELREALRVSGI
jgi:uncharacterized protein (TIGR02246 family)